MVLSIVYPPKGSTIVPTVDIVAVHGLGGDAFTTWTHPKSNAFWLRDFLPQQIPDARILTFGYNAAAAFSQSTAEIVDHAKSLLSSLVDKREDDEEKSRPLIFVAHSLGGIVVKQTLLSAVLEPRYQSIYDATRGIIFFGTPHRGSDKAVYGKMLADIANTMAHQPNSRLLDALRTNSEVLLRLASDFRHQLARYELVSFFELRPMSFSKGLVVEKHSALLDIGNEDSLPVDANHSAMCKFEHAEDETFEKVWKRIKRVKEKSQQAVRPDPELFNKHYQVPHLLTSLFTGRDEVCKRLDESLAQNSQSRQTGQRRFVLFGMGGAGKTQICVRYSQKHRERYWGIFWIDASTQDSIQQSITQVALRLKIDQDIDSVKQALADTPRPWLLVFDNADDPDLPLTSYFPTGDRGDVIITSRNPGCRHYSSVGFEEIKELMLKDAVSLLLKIVNGNSLATSKVEEECKTVALALGCLALAVTQAGSYIRESPCSFTDYVELYRRRRQEVWKYFPKHGDTDYRYTVYTTWQVSLDRIRSMQDAKSQQTLNMLQLASVYHYEQIPLEMFSNAWQQWHQIGGPTMTWHPWSREMTDSFEVRRNLQANMMLLASYSLVTMNNDNSFSLHPLVHEWYCYQLTDAEQLVGSERAIAMLTISVEGKQSSADYAFRRLLVPHILSCLQRHGDITQRLNQSDSPHIKDQVKDATAAYDSSVLAHILWENGFYGRAISLSETAVQLKKSTLGTDHPFIIASMNNLAILYSEAGQREKALALSEQVLQSRKSKLSNDHPDTLKSMHSLAIRYSEVGRQAEALALSEQVWQLQKSKLGDEHPDTLKSMHNLAIRYSEVGRQKKALALSEQVWQLQKSKLGDDHPDTLKSMYNLAIRYSEVGRQKKALALSEQVWQLRKIKLGDDHPDTLSSVHNLAIRYSEVGRQDEALPLSEQVWQLRKIKLGDDHPDTLSSMHNLVIRYGEVGRQEKALALSEQVVQLRKSKLGDDHPETLRTLKLQAFLKQKLDEP